MSSHALDSENVPVSKHREGKGRETKGKQEGRGGKRQRREVPASCFSIVRVCKLLNHPLKSTFMV